MTARVARHETWLSRRLDIKVMGGVLGANRPRIG